MTLPEPYYDADGIVIYHGRCEDILPGLPSVDLVLTDPPYGIGEAAGRNKSRGRLATSVDYGNDAWDDEPIPLDLLTAIVAKGKHAAVFGGNYYPLTPVPSWLIWDKENGATDFADVEMCWTNYGTAARLKRHRWHGMLRKGREPRMHPTQKPVDVMAWVLQLCPGEPATVLDPYMGSGTTLVAAKQLGMRAIGIEMHEKYCAVAVDRLRQGVLFR